MALPDLADLRDSVYALLRDTERVFVVPAVVDAMLNEAYLDLNARLRLKQSLDEGTTSADGVITLPVDFVEAISLWFGDIAATFTNDGAFESYSVPGTTVFTDRILVRYFGGAFETFPVQNAEDYALRYVARPELLVDDTDTPVDLTEELVPRLRFYAVAEAKYQEGETQEAERYMEQYLEGLPGRPRHLHRMNPASVSLIPEAGPFE